MNLGSIRLPRPLVGAVAVAAAQAGLAWRIPYADDYYVTLTIAWTAALIVAWQRPDESRPTPAVAWRALGALALVCAFRPLIGMPVYRTVDRLLPLLAGAGLCLWASGPRGWLIHWKELLLLALPILNPLPRAVLEVTAPTAFTAWCTMVVVRLAGHAASVEGNLVHLVPRAVLEVLPGCSGLLGASRLWVLAALVIALFPTSTRQKVALVLGGLGLAFVTNLGRLVLMSVALMDGNEDRFGYWHQGRGATWSTLGSIAAAGFACWLALQEPGAFRRSLRDPAVGNRRSRSR